MNKSPDRQPAQMSPVAPAARPKAERPLQLRDATLQRQIGVFLVGACVLGVVLVVLLSWLAARREQGQAQRLQALGATTQAQVISRTDVGRGSDRLTYRFTLASPAGARRSFEGTAIIARSRLRFDQDGQIAVIYDPADPRVSRLADDNRPPESALSRMFPFVWLGWPLLLGGLITMLLGRSRQEQARQLDQQGRIAPGVVVERWQSYRRPGGPCVTYQFDAQRPDGQTRQIVKAEIVDLVTRYQRLQVGTPVQVRYLPADPSVCRIEW